MARKSTAPDGDAEAEGFSAEEKAAMKERAAEVKTARKRGKKADGTADVLAKIAEMDDGDRAIAERLHQVILEAAPTLVPRTWYGMPAYAKDGDVLCFFQASKKFTTRYCTLGFSDAAALDDGDMWPSAFAVVALTPAVEKRVAALVKAAMG